MAVSDEGDKWNLRLPSMLPSIHLLLTAAHGGDVSHQVRGRNTAWTDHKDKHMFRLLLYTYFHQFQSDAAEM